MAASTLRDGDIRLVRARRGPRPLVVAVTAGLASVVACGAENAGARRLGVGAPPSGAKGRHHRTAKNEVLRCGAARTQAQDPGGSKLRVELGCATQRQ